MMPGKESIKLKQIKLFQSLKQSLFSGELIFRDFQNKEWLFYMYLGRIIYATGGSHPVRRWRRYIVSHIPQVVPELSEQLYPLNEIIDRVQICWEYDLLSLWVEQGKVRREAAVKLIRAVIGEMLFDLMQIAEIKYELKKQEKLSSGQLALIDTEQSIAQAENIWQAWQAANLISFLPDWAPVIQEPQQLQSLTSVKSYQVLSRFLDGKHTLRDLAALKHTNVVRVASSILPYTRSGLVGLMSIPDLPSPLSENGESMPITSPLWNVEEVRETLIAFVDTSPQTCQNMGNLFTTAGYSFLWENDSLRAIAVLLDRKPDLIFLDDMLFEVDGFEICSQLRQLDCFRKTPIIIFTDRDNILDRLKAKISGCTELLSKTLDPQSVLGLVNKYLKPATLGIRG
jgi:two-component system, chemotaxis family, response regulator PixG